MINEKRLIDAERYRGVLDRYANAPHITMQSGLSKCMRMAIDTCIELLDMQKTVDAVEVVRCKDCDYFTEHNDVRTGRPMGYGECHRLRGELFRDDDFCSYGERRSDV